MPTAADTRPLPLEEESITFPWVSIAPTPATPDHQDSANWSEYLPVLPAAAMTTTPWEMERATAHFRESRCSSLDTDMLMIVAPSFMAWFMREA